MASIKYKTHLLEQSSFITGLFFRVYGGFMKAVRTFCCIFGVMLAIGATTVFADDPTDAHLQPVELKRDLTYKAGNGFVDVFKDNKQVARFNYNNSSKPYIFPLNAPCGSALTSNELIPKTEGEPEGNPSKLSFWTGISDINGIDFWNEGDKCGKIVQKKLDFEPLNSNNWNIHVVNDWVGPDGKKVCEEDRRYSFVSCQYGTLIATLVTLSSSDNILKISDTPQGFLGIHLAPALQFKDGKGQVLNSEGLTNKDCNGKRARWLDVSGSADGKDFGITLFDASFNYGTPAYWRVANSGTIAVNPFGGKSFTNEPANDSSITIRRRQPFTMLYITLLHDGKFSKEMLNTIASQVVGTPQAKPDSTSKPASDQKSQQAPDAKSEPVNKAPKKK